jgi:hypothetical protein
MFAVRNILLPTLLLLLLTLLLLSHNQKSTGKTITNAHTTAKATVLYHVNFEGSTPFPAFVGRQTATNYALQVVDSPVYKGNKAARFELRDSDPENYNGTRAEIAFPKPAAATNLEQWYAFAIFFPMDGFEEDVSDEVISQWHQGGKATPSLCIRTQYNRMKLRIKGSPHSKEWFDMGALQKNTWLYFVIHVKHSSGADGLVTVWCNGAQLINHNGPNMYNLNSGIFHAPNWKLGIYKSAWNGPAATRVSKRVLYLDEISVGNQHATYADMTMGTAEKR